MRIVLRSAATLAFVMLLMLGNLTPGAAQDASRTPEQQLAERYKPVAYLRYQEFQCGVPPYEGEPYLPLPVDIVLNNDRVLLRDGADNDRVIATGPSAQELATYGPTTYLDFPGNPRDPGCTYETDERARIEETGIEPTVYAKIFVDPENHRLALQYWFYWYFNDWNNTHESDWEGIQFMWDETSSIEEALATPPSRLGYAQHGNGEVANWGDSRIELEDGTHPRAYPAAGSHATFFSNNTILAWGEKGSGFGCDVASPPSVRTEMHVILIPDEIDPDSDLAWVLYPGRWGERQPSAFNGPVGPMFNDRWVDPWTTFESWRPFSLVVPESRTLGPSFSQAFCTLTGSGSSLLLRAMARPWVTIPAIAAVVGLFAYFSRGAVPTFRRARKLYGANWKLFTGIGLVSIPIGIIFNILQAFLIRHDPLDWIVKWLDNSGGAYLTTVLAIGGLQQMAMLLVIAPAIIYAVHQVLAGNKISVRDAYTGPIHRIPVIALAFILFIVTISVLALSVIGIPVAIWLAIKWHFFLQVLVFDEESGPIDAFKQSFNVGRRRWFSTTAALILFDLLAIIPGIVVGFGLLTLGRTAVGFANATSSVLYAVLMPLAVIAVTLLYRERRQGNTEMDESVETESPALPVTPVPSPDPA